MNACFSLAMIAAWGAVSAEPVPFARGSPPPSRARGDAYGLANADRPAPARKLPPFVDDEPLAIPETLEVVFYARTRPVRLRIVISGGEKSLAANWQAMLKKLFDGFDRDRDGFLNRYEVEQIFPSDAFSVLFAGGFYSRTGSGPPSLELLDRDGDSRIAFPEFARYYRMVAADLVKARPYNGPNGNQDALTQQLFARLDANKDGKLTRPELRKAERILLALDVDEDECVSAQELLQNSNQNQFARSTAGGMAARPAPQPTTPSEVEVYAKGIPGTIVQQLFKRYDKDTDSALTAQELGFDLEEFASLDRNGDGKLSATELDGWRTGPPNGVVEMLFNTGSQGKVSAKSSKSNWPAGIELRQTEPSRLVIRVGTQTTEFGVSQPPANVRQRQVEAFTRNVFPMGKDVVEESELGGPQNQFVRVIFDSADFDMNGKLTRDELNRYLDLQKLVAETALSVTYVVRTPNLFQMLDENADNKLGVRELRTAWDRMIVLEPAGSDAITKSVMQPSVNFRLSAAAYASFDQNVYATMSGVDAQAPSARPQPIWFLKMDRNGDGDVSRAEFLGTEADFLKIDANKDGLISSAEVGEYEKKVRPGKK